MFSFIQVASGLAGSPQRKTRPNDQSAECRKMKETDDTSESISKCFASIDYALCRFHWQNTISIDIQQVLLIPSYSKEPIELTREVTQELTQFYSKELQVPCAYHSGFLLVDGKKHDLENIQVKNYMFEIDLYIKDDVIDQNQQSELINRERNLKSQQTNMEKQWDEERGSGTPTPTMEHHEIEVVTNKPAFASPASLVKAEQSPVQHLNSSMDESRSVSNMEPSRHKPEPEVLPTVPSSSSGVVDDVLGSKIDELDGSVKPAVTTGCSSSQKGLNCSFSVPVEHEGIHSREVTPQPSRSVDSTSISSCQSLLKDQNFENQLPFCRSLSSSLCQDIPLQLSFSSVSHTSSVDSVLVASQSLDQNLTPSQNQLGNHRLGDANCSEKPKFIEFSSEERASVSLPARFSPSLPFQTGQPMPSTFTGVDANQQSTSENPNPENRFGGAQPALRSPLVTGRSHALRHSTPTLSHPAELHEVGSPIVAKNYPSAKNLHQTAEVNDSSGSNLPPKMADYIDSNQHLAGQLELLRGMNESLLAELVFLRQQPHNCTTDSQSAPSPTPSTTQDPKVNLVSHLKEEKYTLQDEVQKLKEELRQYRHLAAYSQNTPLHSGTSALGHSQDKVNIYHSEELTLRRRIADLQHQVSQLQDSNLSLSAKLVGAQARISQLEADNHKLGEQLQNKEKEVSPKGISKKASQDEDIAKNRTRGGDTHSQADTDSRSESVGGSSIKEKRKKSSGHSRRPSRDLQSSKDQDTINKTERERSAPSAVNVSPNCEPASEELENKVYPNTKKSKKSSTETKSVLGSQSDVSQKQTTSGHNEDKTPPPPQIDSPISNVNDFLSPRKTRWDQYNQVRLNKASIQNLQKSLDEQDILRQAFLAHYKPKACDPSRTSAEGWASYPRANSKDTLGVKSAKSPIIPSTTSDSTSLLLAAQSLPQVCDQRHTYSTNQEFPCEEYSDTGTDVLLRSTFSFEMNNPSSPERKDEGWGHRRRMSIDSVGSSTLTHSDLEMSGSSSTFAIMKKRSQSTEPRGQSVSSRPTEKTITREALKTVNGTRYMDSSSSDDVGKAKKANKKIISGSEASKRQWMSTQGMQPYIPRSSDDMHVEDVVKFSKQSGKISQGTVKFIGPLYGRRDIYIGIELQKEEGKHDGVFEGRRYFRCKPNKGVFVTFTKIVMAWETAYQSSC